MDFKVCTKCKESKSLDKFYKFAQGFAARCKPCQIAATKAWGKANPDKLKANKRKHSALEKTKARHRNYLYIWKFGITLEQYNEMLAKQGGGCAICNKTPDKQNLSVDHDHKSGKVRGLLCSECNFGIGNFKDSPDLMIKAASYVSPSKSSE